MNAITPHHQPATWQWTQLSRELTSLLRDEPVAEAAINGVARSEALKREAERALPLLREAMRPAGDKGVVGALTPLLAIYREGQNRRPEEWAAWWSQYIDDLASFSQDALEDAVREYRRSTAEFFPKPGQIRELAAKHAVPVQRAVYRCQKALEAPLPHAKPEDASLRKRLVAEAVAAVTKCASPPKPVLPPVRSRIDETGLSPEMRSLIEKKRGEG